MTEFANKGNFKNHARSGNINTDWRKGNEARKTSFKSNYKVVESHLYEKVTSLDVETRQEYAKSLIARHLNTNKKYINIRLHKQSQTSTALDEVYYVKVLKKSWGKISIRVQRTFRGTDLYFILQRKAQAQGQGMQLGTVTDKAKPAMTARQQNRINSRMSKRHH